MFKVQMGHYQWNMHVNCLRHASETAVFSRTAGSTTLLYELVAASVSTVHVPPFYGFLIPNYAYVLTAAPHYLPDWIGPCWPWQGGCFLSLGRLCSKNSLICCNYRSAVWNQCICSVKLVEATELYTFTSQPLTTGCFDMCMSFILIKEGKCRT